MWKPYSSWSAEEEHGTHGGAFDGRPVLMVHLPGSDTSHVVSKPVNLHLLWLTIARGGSAIKNKGHPPVASGRLVEMRAFGLVAVRLFRRCSLGVRLLTRRSSLHSPSP